MRHFTYLLKRRCAGLAARLAGLFFFFSLSFFCFKTRKSRPECNLLPLASCKAIPSTPAVINLSQ